MVYRLMKRSIRQSWWICSLVWEALWKCSLLKSLDLEKPSLHKTLRKPSFHKRLFAKPPLDFQRKLILDNSWLTCSSRMIQNLDTSMMQPLWAGGTYCGSQGPQASGMEWRLRFHKRHGFPLTNMSNKSLLASESHFSNTGSWKAGSLASNPRRLKA